MVISLKTFGTNFFLIIIILLPLTDYSILSSLHASTCHKQRLLQYSRGRTHTMLPIRGHFHPFILISSPSIRPSNNLVDPAATHLNDRHTSCTCSRFQRLFHSSQAREKERNRKKNYLLPSTRNRNVIVLSRSVKSCLAPITCT